jgi:hypothetical protein
LINRPRERGDCAIHVGPHRERGLAHDATACVIGIGLGAESDACFVHLWLSVEIRQEACDAPSQEDQESGRKGIERPGVPDARLA